jgi:TPP-dependent pyruvate/acetoin dehydrogenase alpha subunit
MVRTRALDEKIEELLQQGVSMVQHATIGQEATPVTAIAACRDDDYVMPYHRGWAWAIGKGMSPSVLLAELMGKKTGCCKGKSGPHLADWNLRIMGRPGIQGAHLSIAAGVGLGLKMQGSANVVLTFFGNGASNTCNFHEGLNLAAVWKAPVVYICENNLYAIYTTIDEESSVQDIADRAVGYGIPGYIVDGNDVISIYTAVSEAAERARRGEGPSLIEAKTYRWLGHTSLDQMYYGGYRPKEEVDEWKNRCPVRRFHGELIEAGLMTEDDAREIVDAAKHEMDEAADFALESEYPTLEEYTDPRDTYVI